MVAEATAAAAAAAEEALAEEALGNGEPTIELGFLVE